MQQLLEVVHDLFEEQTSLDDVILKIMQRAQVLLKCERCSVLLKDPTSEVRFVYRSSEGPNIRGKDLIDEFVYCTSEGPNIGGKDLIDEFVYRFPATNSPK